MKATVDSTKCNGYGTCGDEAPTVFQLDEWGYAGVIGDGTVADTDKDAACKAAEGCPERAITLHD